VDNFTTMNNSTWIGETHGEYTGNPRKTTMTANPDFKRIIANKIRNLTIQRNIAILIAFFLSIWIIKTN